MKMMLHRAQTAGIVWAGCRNSLIVYLGIVGLTAGLYGQVGGFGSIDFDDRLYLTENCFVQQGLTPTGIIWAFDFKHKENTYWQPLTWLSLMLDYELYGLAPGNFHRVNVILHILNALLLFRVLQQMTRSNWASGLTAVCFAVHPINVESVAWIAERKNVLSTLFWMLTLAAYIRYAARPTAGRKAVAVLTFMLGLMAKPMLITLPFVLILLDVWPLRRLNGSGVGRTAGFFSEMFQKFAEKWPFFLLSAACLMVVAASFKDFNLAAPDTALPLGLRVQNVLVSYTIYMGKLIWPTRLAVFYPYPEAIPLWHSNAAGIFLLLISWGAMRTAKTKPWIGVGWLWFLGTMVPVAGLFQAGLWPAMADRFVYVPQIGLFMAVIWTLSELVGARFYRRVGLAVAGLTAVLILSMVTWRQIGYWKNSFSLYEHALEVTKDNYLVHYNCGVLWSQQGCQDEAIHHYIHALKIFPAYAEAHYNLGVALAEQGKTKTALAHYQAAVCFAPDMAKAYCNIGNILQSEGNHVEAQNYYRKAIDWNPSLAEVHFNLGNSLHATEQCREALLHYRAALRIDSKFVGAYNNIGRLLAEKGRLSEAIRYFDRALEIDPGCVESRHNRSLALKIRQTNMTKAGITKKCSRSNVEEDN